MHYEVFVFGRGKVVGVFIIEGLPNSGVRLIPQIFSSSVVGGTRDSQIEKIVLADLGKKIPTVSLVDFYSVLVVVGIQNTSTLGF